MKKRRYSEKEIICILVILFVLFGTVNCMAQTNKITKDMSQKLKEKVLLNDSQTKSIENIINNYINAKNDNKSLTELEKIKNSATNILDGKQKIKFDVIKNNWWAEIDENISVPKAK
jgi:hypothetical protein